jgi:hypothetical protein
VALAVLVVTLGIPADLTVFLFQPQMPFLWLGRDESKSNAKRRKHQGIHKRLL